MLSLAAGERERQLAYWRQQLGGEQPVLELPTDRPRPSVQSPAGDSLQVELGEDLGRSLKQLAQQQGVTLFMLLLASFHRARPGAGSAPRTRRAQPRMKASRSALITSAWVVGMPCGNPG
ncbi:peptide synthase [Pseudomonas aeruginosa PA38182]|nr:peptide synthase [Pseudomonas aeruginosa PA38182]